MVTVSDFMRASARDLPAYATLAAVTPAYADLGAISCAANYGLDSVCDFDAAGPLRAEGVTNVPVRGADTREECAERVMSQHPTADGASF